MPTMKDKINQNADLTDQQRTECDVNLAEAKDEQLNIKSETDQFRFLYNYNLKINKFIRKPEENHKDLIAYYEKLGYTIPNMTLKNDIFFANPLLEDNKDNIVDYYSNMGNKVNYKHLIYAQNMNSLVSEELHKAKNITNIDTEDKKSYQGYNYNDMKKEREFKDMRKENTKLELYNDKMKKILYRESKDKSPSNSP